MLFFFGLIVYVGVFIWALFLIFKSQSDIAKELDQLKTPTLLTNAKLADLGKEVDRLNAQVAALHVQIEQKDAALRDRDDGIRGMGSRLELMGEESARCHAEIEKLKTDLEQKENALAKATAEAKISANEAQVQKAAVADLEEEVKGLRQALEDARNASSKTVIDVDHEKGSRDEIVEGLKESLRLKIFELTAREREIELLKNGGSSALSKFKEHDQHP